MSNSSEAELKQRVDENFEKLESIDQGRIPYLKFRLDKMFFITNNVVAALQTFLNNFSEEGLSKTVGENG